MKLFTGKISVGALVGSVCFNALAASDADVDRLTTYATLLGRAVGCGLNTSSEAARVGDWMDQRFLPGSDDQQTYLPIFMAGVQENARRQSQGESPDSCASVKEQYSLVKWP